MKITLSVELQSGRKHEVEKRMVDAPDYPLLEAMIRDSLDDLTASLVDRAESAGLLSRES